MSAWSPFRYRVYRYLWIALLASNIGTWMQAVGAAWLMVQLDGSPAVVALVQTASSLPVVLVGVAAGAVADLVERRRLLLITQAFMVAAAGGLAVLTALDAVTPLSLLGFTFALGLGAAFNYPAWQAIQPELVPKEEFTQAITLGGANTNLGRAIGPAVGGLLIAAAGVAPCFLFNAVSFVAVIVALAVMRTGELRSSKPVPREPGQVREGLLPEPEFIFVTYGSGSTAAGLIAGTQLAGLSSRVVAVRVVDKIACNRQILGYHVNRAIKFINRHCPGTGLRRVPPGEILFVDDFAGPTYARFTPEGMEAVRKARECDGIKLDGTYTGKTMAAALDFLTRNGMCGRPALFWNTLNSADLWPQVKDLDYHALPAEFHRYFEEPLQEEEMGCPIVY